MPNPADARALPPEAEAALQMAVDAYHAVLAAPKALLDNLVRPPLTPATGGWSIDPSGLRTADIIVSTTDALRSTAIRVGTFSPVSHSAVYVGDGLVVEAVGEGVVLRTMEESLADETLAVALRFERLSLDDAAKIRDYAGRQLDKPYNIVGLIAQAGFKVLEAQCARMFPGEPAYSQCVEAVWQLWFEPTEPNKFFCSQLVIDAYANAGRPLTALPGTAMSPGDVAALALTGDLRYAGHLLWVPPAERAERALGDLLKASGK